MDRNSEISRRNFLAGTSALALGGPLLGARGLAATLEGRTKPIILGSGKYKYECIHDWLVPPADILYGDTHGVAQDAQGRIYVAHTVHPDSKSDHAVCVFDRHGKFLTSWGERFKGGAHGLDIRREGHEEFLYHCDIAHHEVVKTKLDGTVVWVKGVPQEPGVYKDGAPYTPTNVAFSPNGDFYVADGYGSNWIHQYNVAGEYIRTFGGSGTEPGKVVQPHGLWVDPRGSEPTLAIADRGNHRIQYFSLDGKHIKFVTNGMRQPCDFAIRKDVMLVPDLRSVVTLLDHDNQVVAQLGDGDPSNLRDAPRDKFIPGKFIHPHDAIFLNNGDILVAEWVPIGRVTLLRHVR